MTIAVCLNCGAFKHGAWTRCGKCGYIPDDDESYTKHLLATDHYLTRERLEELAARVKAGDAVEFPAEVLEQMRVRKADVDKANRGCVVRCVVVLMVVIVALASIVFWLLWQRS